jgi:hypothetical protein
MDREDSGLIDLMAIHARSKAAMESMPPPAPAQSAPPAPVTMDAGASSGALGLDPLDDLDGLEAPFAKSRRKPILVGLGVVAALAVIGIAALSGGDDGAAKTAAAGAAKTEATAAPSPSPSPPPPVAAPAPSPSPNDVASAAPPTTAKSAPARAPQPVVRAAARPAPAPVAAGPKLTKVQSAGVAP